MGVKKTPSPSLLRLTTVIVGGGGIVGQLVLLRELLVTFYGNELTVGVVLANWLAAEAAGAAWGGRLRRKAGTLFVYLAGLIAYAVFLPLSIFLSRGSRTIFFELLPGEAAPAEAVFLTTLVIMAPAALTHGALYPLGCTMLEKISDRKQAAGRIYLWETIGTLGGGALFTVLLAERFLPTSIALGVSFLHLTGCVVLLTSGKAWKERPWLNAACWATVALMAVSIPILTGTLHELSIRRQWHGHQLVEYQNSPYGNIVVTQHHGEYTFFYDGRPVLSLPIPDTALVEDFTTLVAAAHPAPQRVIVLGGGLGGLVNGFLAHPPVEKVISAELDPQFPDVLAQYTSPLIERELTDNRTHVVRQDGRRYLAHTKDHFDLIVLGFLEPDTLQANRLFTREFFALAEKRLAPGGVVAVPLPGSPVYLGEELAAMNRSTYRTLNELFPHVACVPGEYNLFLASNASLDLSPALFFERLEERALSGTLATRGYLEYRLDPVRLAWVNEILERESGDLNYDFHPRTFFHALTYWGRTFSPGLERFLAILRHTGLFPLTFITLVPAAIAPFLRKRKISGRPFITWAIGTSGACGMAFDFLLLLILQALYGFVYQATGLIVAAFMGGTFAGGWWALYHVEKPRESAVFTRLEIAVCALMPALGCMAIVLQHFQLRISDITVVSILSLFALISGGAVGAQFPLACSFHSQQGSEEHLRAGGLYAADLAGGWLGGMALAFFLFPLFGLWGSVVFLLLLKLGSIGAIMCFLCKAKDEKGISRWQWNWYF